MSRIITLVSALALVAGCLSDAAPDKLDLEETDQSVSGSFVAADETKVVFESFSADASSVEVTVGINGMLLVLTADQTGLAVDMDGFANNGEDTQLTDPDRAVLVELLAVLEETTDAKSSVQMSLLHRAISIWTEYPDTLDLRQRVLNEIGHGTSKICWARWTYYSVTHDGPGSWVGGCGKDNWEDRSSYKGYINNTGAYPYTDGTIFQRDGAGWYGWTSGEIDHPSNYEKAQGECFGNCGGGCQGSGKEFTDDCADHDSCVRFGHSTVSISCQDEFNSTIDDEAFNWDEPC